MHPVTPALIRAGRALLGWSMLDLADRARISISTVKRYEDGKATPASIGDMQQALETEGVRFLADDGNGPGLRFVARQDRVRATGG